MRTRLRIIRALIAGLLACAYMLGVLLWLDVARLYLPMPARIEPTPTPRFSQSDAWVVAVIATYEAQVLPEPQKSQAYTAIAWTMRNRVEIGFGGLVSYADDRVTSRYAAYADHKNDLPDPHALDIARLVLGAENNADDPTHGARHYVDNSFWTGTHEQIGAQFKTRGKFSDTDVQRLADAGVFDLIIEWKAPPTSARGAVYYGFYFFDDWPPPMPIVTPFPTATRKPTATVTRTATATPTLTATPRITATRTLALTQTLTATLSLTVTKTPTMTVTVP